MSTSIPSGIATRLNYYDGMFLTSTLMTVEQDYFSNWIRLQNQLLYNAGVLQGLKVSLDTNNPNALAIDGGAAIDAAGNLLLVPGAGVQLTLPAGPGPICVFAVYPTATANLQADTFDQAASIQCAALTPDNAVELAQCTGGDGKWEVTDKRQPVTSRLPINLDGDAQADLLTSKLDKALRDEYQVPVTTLQEAGQGTSARIYFNQQRTPAFSARPVVHVTVHGQVPFATSVTGIDAIGFEVHLTAVQPHNLDVATLQWLAFSPT
jgi:hypothetical protein